MTVDDRTRLNLHRKLDSVLGPEEADTLMAHLPPATCDVATKDDVRHEISILRSEMHVGVAEIRTEIADAMTRQIKWMVTFAAAWSSLLIAAVRLIP